MKKIFTLSVVIFLLLLQSFTIFAESDQDICEVTDELFEKETKIYDVQGQNYEITNNIISDDLSKTLFIVNGVVSPVFHQGESYVISSDGLKLRVDKVSIYTNEELDSVDICLYKSNDDFDQDQQEPNTLKGNLKEDENRVFTLNGVDYEILLSEISSGSNPYVRFVVNGEVTINLNENEEDTLSDGLKIKPIIILNNDATETNKGEVIFWLESDNSDSSNCYDSDGGKDYYKKGLTSSYTTDGTPYSNTDTCCIYTEDPDGSSSCSPANQADHLSEQYCALSNDGSGLGEFYAYPKIYKCPNGCNNGVCAGKENHKLENYPDMFFDNYNNFNGVIVVGDKASVEQVLYAQEIAANLNVDTIKLANEVTSLDQNIISVGSGCANQITWQIENFPTGCNYDLERGKGLIKIHTHNGYAHLVVKGYADVDTKDTVQVLVNYQKYDLEGTEHTVILDEKYQKCIDTDNGKNYFKKGVSSGYLAIAILDQNSVGKYDDYSDYCLSEATVVENYCALDAYGKKYVFQQKFNCINGCEAGVCNRAYEHDVDTVAPRNMCVWYTNGDGCKFQECYGPRGELVGGGAGCKVDFTDNCDEYIDEDGCKIKECYNENSQIILYKRMCNLGKFETKENKLLPVPLEGEYIVVVGKKAPSNDVVTIANFAATMKANYGIEFTGMIHDELLAKLNDLDLEKTVIVSVQGSGYSIMRGSEDYEGVVARVENYFLAKDFHKIKLIGPYMDVIKVWISDWLISGDYPSSGIVYDKDGYITYTKERPSTVVETIVDSDSGVSEEIIKESTTIAESICTNGCKLDGKCLPFGQRVKNGKASYCDISGEFVEQKEENEACQNNYECETNSCQSGSCVDLAREIRENRNLLQKIADWLGSIFGFSSE